MTGTINLYEFMRTARERAEQLKTEIEQDRDALSLLIRKIGAAELLLQASKAKSTEQKHDPRNH